MPPTSFDGIWRTYGRRSLLLSLLVLIASLSLVYVAIASRRHVENSPSSRAVSSMRSHPSSSQHEHKWCPYYPASVDEIDNIFDSNSLLDLHIVVQTTLTKDAPISLLVASESVLPMLINWMCVTRKSTGSLPENLLVVVPPGDSSVIMNLESKEIPVVQMEFSKECRSKMPSNMRSFMQPIAVRVLTVMLLTDPSWGYDVAVYDPDAFVLHDPTEMYDSVVKRWGADVVAQMARFPPSLSAVWGFTLCMGAAYYKSSPRLMSLWVNIEKKHRAASTSKLQLNDQALFNQALKEMNVEWEQVPFCESSLGRTKAGLKVIALGRNCSFRKFKGQNLDKEDDLSVIHPMLGHDMQSKINALRKSGLWDLKVHPVASLSSDSSAMNSKDWLNTVCSSQE